MRQKPLKRKESDITRLEELMERLRGPGGCPWDAEQTFESLVPFIIEEAYEVVAAIEAPEEVRAAEVQDEAGDLLFQVIFICRLATEAGWFDLSDVIETTMEKMVRRHPHVFGDTVAETPEEVLDQWAEIKSTESAIGSDGTDDKTDTPLLASVPAALPSLLRAHKLSKKAARVGFDWTETEQVLDKLTEEVEEFKEAVRAGDESNMEEELGDILFTLVNTGRFLKINSEEALRKSINKFILRFGHIEQRIKNEGKELSNTPLERLEELWQEAKRK
ncbi:MAG: nucleoside triphosphate pyrophosphohydrolase [Proteobacteria bacterium]|nr:nucleoside triphosphate pyrophosphohydrolase [Pseudomonadota bacterium]